MVGKPALAVIGCGADGIDGIRRKMLKTFAVATLQVTLSDTGKDEQTLAWQLRQLTHSGITLLGGITLKTEYRQVDSAGKCLPGTLVCRALMQQSGVLQRHADAP
jgi:hypothetical protein